MKNLIITLTLLLITGIVFSQQPDTNSILRTYRLAKTNLDARKFDEANQYAQQALTQSMEAHYQRGIAKAHGMLGNVAMNTNKTQEALIQYYQCLENYKQYADTNCQQYIGVTSNIGIVFYNLGLLDKSVDQYLKALKIAERIKDTDMVAMVNTNLANLYRTLGDNAKARTYYNSVYKLITKDADTIFSYPPLFIGLGFVEEQVDFNKSLNYYKRVLNIGLATNDSVYVYHAYNCIGTLYKSIKQYDSAIAYVNKSLVFREDINNTNSYLYLGEMYMDLKQYKLAYQNFAQSMNIAKRIQYKGVICSNYKNLYQLDSITKKYEPYAINYKMYISYRDSIYSMERDNKIMAQQMNYNFEKEKAIIKLRQQEHDRITDLQAKRQRDVITLGSILLILVTIASVFIYRGYKKQSKANLVISAQKKVVEESKKELTDNITYAKRIQTGLLPNKECIDYGAKNNFILYKPKDIVSGDFYWASNTEGKFYLATCDSTGHGVSGAFMSLLNMRALDYGLECEYDTGLILETARTYIVDTLNPNGNEEVMDGMDCNLCAFDFKKRTLTYSCANNSFYIIRGNAIITCTADKMPVGLGVKKDEFTTNTISLEPNDMVYMFTDGYADQFGGPNNKKFRYKQFEETLMAIKDLPMSEQQVQLLHTFNSWKGKNTQTDDVLVIGIKID